MFNALPASWRVPLANYIESDSAKALIAFLKMQQAAGKTIYPAKSDLFTALTLTPFDRVKVVILGQDPYHGPGQAHGLSFSVPAGVKVPPSLKNIYKEIHRDLGHPISSSGTLTDWADQGVLLLNSVLTVEAGKAGSHQKKGWEGFTDLIIDQINTTREGVVFMLWGSHAQKKASFVDREKHLVLESVHPSPLSAHRGFIGCGHFKSANRYLQDRGDSPIDWRVKEPAKSQFSLI